MATYWQEPIEDGMYGFNSAMGWAIEPLFFVAIALVVAFIIYAIVSNWS